MSSLLDDVSFLEKITTFYAIKKLWKVIYKILIKINILLKL